MSRKFVCLLSIITALCLFPGCSCEPPSPKGSGSAGVGDTEILIGSSCALTGHASFLGTHTTHGFLAYINHINEQGGINGRRIKLIAYDDAYDPARCVANTQKLIVEDRVFALTSYVGTPTAVKIIPIVSEARIPVVGLISGATALRDPFQRYIINIRASYYEETGELVRHFVEELGITKVAVFYQYDEYGFDGLTGTELALKKYGLKPVVKANYVRGTMDVEEAVSAITNSDAEAVVMIGTYGPCAKFIKLAKERKHGLIFHTVSFVGSEELVNSLGPEAEGVIITQAVPPPWETALLPGVDLYCRLLSRYFPEDEPSFTGLEGFTNARVLVEGLKRAGPDLTREGLIDTIESVRQYSLGMANAVNFSPTNHQGFQNVYFTEIRDGKLTLLTNWNHLKKMRAVHGVSPTEIVFGSSSALTGDNSFLGTQTLRGALAYLNYVNEKGGIHGRRIKLISYDDRYDPDLCEANTRKLISEDKVFGLTCYVGTPTTLRVLPMVREAQIPMVGMFTGATALRKPVEKWVINIRASCHEEIEAVVNSLVKGRKLDRIAVFYQNDSYGLDGLEGARLALGKYDLQPVAAGSYEIGSTDVEEAAARIIAGNPQAVVMIGTCEPCAKLIRTIKERAFRPVFHCVSFVGVEELVKKLGTDAEGVIITQVVPPPWETVLLPAAEEYNTLLARYFPEDKPNFAGFEGFVNMKVLVEALRRIGSEVTRDRLIEVLEQMEYYSPGIGTNINLSKTDHQGFHQVYMTTIRGGRLVLLRTTVQQPER